MSKDRGHHAFTLCLLIQKIKHEVVFCQNIEKTTAKSSGDVDQELQKMALERKDLTMQQEIDRLQEQLRIRDLEVEGLKARYGIL